MRRIPPASIGCLGIERSVDREEIYVTVEGEGTTGRHLVSVEVLDRGQPVATADGGV